MILSHSWCLMYVHGLELFCQYYFLINAAVGFISRLRHGCRSRQFLKFWLRLLLLPLPIVVIVIFVIVVIVKLSHTQGPVKIKTVE